MHVGQLHRLPEDPFRALSRRTVLQIGARHIAAAAVLVARATCQDNVASYHRGASSHGRLLTV